MALQVGSRLGHYAYTEGGLGIIRSRQYDVAPDGRFLMLKEDTPTDETATPTARLILVQNWFEELTRLVPVP